MADLNLSLSLINKGTPGGFSLKNLNTSKPITNTFNSQGFKPNEKNTSNVNSKEVHKVTKSAKTEPKHDAAAEEKSPAHDEVFPSSPSPQGGYEVTDLVGRRHQFQYGVSQEEILDTVLGHGWLAKDLWTVGEGIVQGLSIEATGGASTLMFAGKAWGSIKNARRVLLGFKTGVSTARYMFDPSMSHGDPNSFIYSLLLAGGSNIGKFGNVHDLLDGLVDKNSPLYTLAHSSHVWHSKVNQLSFATTGRANIQTLSRYNFGGGVKLNSLKGLADFKQTQSFTLNNLYTNFGVDNLEKQWFNVTAAYKGKTFKSPYQYQQQYKAGEHHGETNDLYNSKSLTQRANDRLYNDIDKIYLDTGKQGTAYDRYISRMQQNKAEGLNVLGEYVDEFRNQGLYMSEIMDENNIHIQNDNWLVKEQLVNGTPYEKAMALLGLPETIAKNVRKGLINTYFGAASLVQNATETVVTPLGELLYDAWFWGAVKLTVKNSDSKHKITKETKHSNGTTTLHINTAQDYYDKMKTQNWEYDKFGGRVAKKIKPIDFSAIPAQSPSMKAIYDNRARLQKELAALKKEHERGWIYTKPWTEKDISQAKWLTMWIQTYNDQIILSEEYDKKFPPLGGNIPKKVSVETPRKNH